MRGGVEFLLKIIGLEIIRVFLIPFFTFLSMLFPFATSIPAGLLTTLEPGVGGKPTATNPARTLFVIIHLMHRFPSWIFIKGNDLKSLTH